MSYTTQCPGCQTRFKVNDKQLSAANGLVRCGRCSHVFNATEHFVTTDSAPPVLTPPPVTAPPSSPPPAPAVASEALPPAAMSSSDPMDDFELELPDFDPQAAGEEAQDLGFLTAPPAAPLAEAHAEEEEQSKEAEEFQRALAEALNTRSSARPSANYAEQGTALQDDAPLPDVFGNKRRRSEQDNPPDDAPTPTTVPAGDGERIEPVLGSTPNKRALNAYAEEQADLPLQDEEEEPAPRARRNPLLTAAMLLLSLLGVALLMAQLIYFNRTRIATEVPEARPALEAFCKLAGCNVPWPSDIAQIRTEWSELAFVPEHPNLIQLSATLKNHANYVQNYPMLEVSLKDADDQILIRKVFAPKDYLRPDDFKLFHFNANSEVKVTMRLDAGKVRAMGYSLYWFYP